MRTREPFVYILASGYNGTLYVGVTSDLPSRLIEHREERFEGFTKRYGVKTLVYFESADSIEAAIVREKQLKRWRRDWKRNLIERSNPAWKRPRYGISRRRRGPRRMSGVTIGVDRERAFSSEHGFFIARFEPGHARTSRTRYFFPPNLRCVLP